VSFGMCMDASKNLISVPMAITSTNSALLQIMLKDLHCDGLQ